MLDHNLYENQDILKVAKDLDEMCISLDQKHRQQRKIQFFLDIRGYYLSNKVEGNYVEFGVYRGEMTYCAWKVLEKTGCFRNYIGLDTFCGEPKLSSEERDKNPFTQEGAFNSELTQTTEFLKKFIGDKVKLIQGDFRKDEVIQQAEDKENKVALAVIDCNLMSSIEKSLEFTVSQIVPGGVLFIDDYFMNMGEGNCPMDDLLKKIEDRDGCKFLEYKTYPPFARAFIVTNKPKG